MLSFMKGFILAVSLMMVVPMAQAQSRFWVEFTDKGPQAAQRLQQPEMFLSAASLSRRQAQHIPVTYSDLPVESMYVNGVLNCGVTHEMSSKWLNGTVIQGSYAQVLLIESLPYVRRVRPLGPSEGGITSADSEGETLNYGQSIRQLKMLNLPSLHDQGFRGQGMRIAVIDAGFPGVDTLEVFDSLRTRGGILDTYDFVEDTTWAYTASSHGTRVLSTISTYLPGKIVGAAPEASVLLYRTEDARREVQMEEFYWVAAVERADSVGVDIIHTSLGYNKFQDSPGYEYEDLDGNKAIITTAGDMAAGKGILVITSAGNEGNKRWKYITAPCDGDSILCVGSVTRWNDRSSFSSVGPAADGRIKPDVVAMGTATTTAGPTPRLQLSNGTSFAAPIVAGMSACIWQANRSKSNVEIMDAIRLSSDQAGLPDSDYGYGIPNAAGADSLLKTGQDLSSLTIVQASRPPRGREAIEAAQLARADRTPEEPEWTWEAYKLIIPLPEGETNVSKVIIKRGDQFVTTDDDSIEQVGQQVRIDTEIWLPGLYEITVETISSKLVLEVQVPRA